MCGFFMQNFPFDIIVVRSVGVKKSDLIRGFENCDSTSPLPHFIV